MTEAVRNLHEISNAIYLQGPGEIELASYLFHDQNKRKSKKTTADKTKLMNSILKFVRSRSGAHNVTVNYHTRDGNGTKQQALFVVGPKQATEMLGQLITALGKHLENQASAENFTQMRVERPQKRHHFFFLAARQGAVGALVFTRRGNLRAAKDNAVDFSGPQELDRKGAGNAGFARTCRP